MVLRDLWWPLYRILDRVDVLSPFCPMPCADPTGAEDMDIALLTRKECSCRSTSIARMAGANKHGYTINPKRGGRMREDLRRPHKPRISVSYRCVEEKSQTSKPHHSTYKITSFLRQSKPVSALEATPDCPAFR